MRARMWWGALALAVVAAAAWLLFGSGASDDDEAAAARVSVEANNGAFPAEKRLRVGSVAVFANEDSIEHTFTADGGLFDSGPLAPGQSYSFNVAAPGEVSYHCEIHPSMKGRLVVEAESRG